MVFIPNTTLPLFERTAPVIITFLSIDVVALVGLFFYIMVIIAVLTNRKKKFSGTFYILMISMGFADIAGIAVHFGLVNASAIFGEENLPINYIIFWGWFWEVVNNASTNHIPFIALNRLLAVFCPMTYENYFGKLSLSLIIAFCWGFELVYATVMYWCTIIVHVPSLATAQYFEEDSCAEATRKGRQLQDIITIAVSVVLNAATFMKVRMIRKSMTTASSAQSKKELKMLFQFATIFVVFSLFCIVFWIIGFLGSIVKAETAELILTALFMIHSTINPFMLMGFGSDVKQVAMAILCGTSSQPVGSKVGTGTVGSDAGNKGGSSITSPG